MQKYQGNPMESNVTMYNKNYKGQSRGLYSRYARIVQYLKISIMPIHHYKKKKKRRRRKRKNS